MLNSPSAADHKSPELEVSYCVRERAVDKLNSSSTERCYTRTISCSLHIGPSLCEEDLTRYIRKEKNLSAPLFSPLQGKSLSYAGHT